MPITKRQREVLEFLIAFRERDGRMPTGPEIATHFGFRDPSPAYQHLDALAVKGYLKIKRYGPGRPRSITFTGASGPTLYQACLKALTCTSLDNHVRRFIEEALTVANQRAKPIPHTEPPVTT